MRNISLTYWRSLMSDETDLINTLVLYVELDEDGGLNVSGAQYLDQDLEPEMAQYLTCLMRGMFVLFDDLTDTFVHVGSLMEAYSEMVEKAEQEISFEADPELLKAIAESKIIPFKKKS